MTAFCLFFYNTDFVVGFREQLGSTNALAFVILFVGINGLVEAAVNFVIGAVVSKTLYYVVNDKKYSHQEINEEDKQI